MKKPPVSLAELEAVAVFAGIPLCFALKSELCCSSLLTASPHLSCSPFNFYLD